MDPLTLQAANLGVVRPAIALQSDLSAVLREGRVLAGEVLQSFGGGALLIGVGRHRVPAQGSVALEEGYRFLFVVEGEGETLALRILGGGASDESALLRALRSVLGLDQPVGKLLESVLHALAPGSAGEVARGIGTHLLQPGEGVLELVEQLRCGAGLAYEARLAVPAVFQLPAAELARLAAELEAWLVDRLASAGGLPEPGPGHSRSSELLEALRTELPRILQAGDPSASREQAFAAWLAAGEGPGRTPPTLAGLLEAAIHRLFEGVAREELSARLRSAPLASLGRGLEAVVLRRLLGLGNPLPAMVEEQVRGALQQASGDLKALLLRALEGAPDGAPKAAVARALGGLEAEQLLNVARSLAGEGQHWSFPIADGPRWATLHLFVHPRRQRPGDADAAEDERSHRLSLAVDLSRTGPLQADLLARPGELLVRVTASRAEVVDALGQGKQEVETRLAIGGRRVRVVLALAPEEQLRAGESSTDVRFLREHHLMDLSA